MKHSLTILLLLISLICCAQKHTIKARAFGLPGGLKVYSLGLGYERMISENKAVQVLFNKIGYDFEDNDGFAKKHISIVPEYRYYFGKSAKTDINKSVFLGLFTEFALNECLPGPEQKRTKKYLLSEKQVVLSPGVLLGKNLKISETFFFDIYLGVKYRFVSEKEE